MSTPWLSAGAGARSGAGGDDWFRLGDRDLGLHLVRTELLHSGASLSEATAKIAQALGLPAALAVAVEAAARWHDLGKIEELGYERSFHYTTRGQLIGHITIGLEMVQSKMRAVADFPAPLKDRLEHIILSHHGKLEFGSPKEPAFPEALVVHYLDDLDSKLAAMRAQYASDKDREGDFTSRNRALGRELLKPGPPDHQPPNL